MKSRKIFTCLSILWLCVIFGHSLMPAEVSSSESLGVLAWLIKIFPWLTHHLLRKLAHFSAFALLGGLFTAAMRPEKLPLQPVMCALCAAFIDETIQLFVEGRSGQVSDMWIDLSGAVCGALIACLLLKMIPSFFRK